MSENPIVARRIIQAGFDNCCMSVISLHELYYGAFHAKKKGEKFYKQEIARIEKLIEKLHVLPLESSSSIYGGLKYELERKGLMIDEFDILIASHAISKGLTVVTDNTKHFNRVPDLKIENWCL